MPLTYEFQQLNIKRCCQSPSKIASTGNKALHTFSLRMQGLEQGNAESSGAEAIFEAATKQQSSADDDFMRAWLAAISLEEEGLLSRRAAMWTVAGKALAFAERHKRYYM